MQLVQWLTWVKGLATMLALTITLVTANTSDDMEELTDLLTRLLGER